jgi:hypothetical protein
MRFCAQGARVFVPRVWILAFLVTPMLMLFTFSSSQPELTSSLERESLDGGTCGGA